MKFTPVHRPTLQRTLAALAAAAVLAAAGAGRAGELPDRVWNAVMVLSYENTVTRRDGSVWRSDPK